MSNWPVRNSPNHCTCGHGYGNHRASGGVTINNAVSGDTYQVTIAGVLSTFTASGTPTTTTIAAAVAAAINANTTIPAGQALPLNQLVIATNVVSGVAGPSLIIYSNSNSSTPNTSFTYTLTTSGTGSLTPSGANLTQYSFCIECPNGNQHQFNTGVGSNGVSGFVYPTPQSLSHNP